jgi:CMP-N-acetylneuraminic acid synthetase
VNIPEVKALIFMKANSERVPGKNIRPLCGKPLFHWIMESLSRSQFIREVIINTDSPLIAEDAEKHFGATIHFRPDWLCGDMVGASPLIDYDIKNTDGEYFLQTHSTNPMLTAETIDRAIHTFFGQSLHDSLFSVTPVQTRMYWPDGRGINHDPDRLIRTQDLTPILEENSCIYIFSREGFMNRGNRIGCNPMMFPMNRYEAIDIDEEYDFAFTETLMKQILSSRQSSDCFR